MEATVRVTYSDPDPAGRLRVRRWCGEHDDVPLTPDMLENLRGVYLPPLRDAAQSLRPSRTSQLARLIQLLSDQPGRDAIDAALSKLDKELKRHEPLITTEKSIVDRHAAMIGPQLIQTLALGLSASDFRRLAARLSLLVDNFEIEMNGLGFNNLIFMAVVLSELAKNPDASFRGLIIEEPEAHLHPQLQAVLLRYLSAIPIGEGEKPVQVFVTSHSPNFASIARLDCLSCLFVGDAGVEAFFPRQVEFQTGKREKLEAVPGCHPGRNLLRAAGNLRRRGSRTSLGQCPGGESRIQSAAPRRQPDQRRGPQLRFPSCRCSASRR